jgi:hypothetical protein
VKDLTPAEVAVLDAAIDEAFSGRAMVWGATTPDALSAIAEAVVGRESASGLRAELGEAFVGVETYYLLLIPATPDGLLTAGSFHFSRADARTLHCVLVLGPEDYRSAREAWEVLDDEEGEAGS